MGTTVGTNMGTSTGTRAKGAKSRAELRAARAAEVVAPSAARSRGRAGGDAASVLRKAAADSALVTGDRPVAPGARARGVEALQRLAGNRAVCDLLSVGQAKLDVGPAGDRYEQEADTLARRVVSALQGPDQTPAAPGEGDEEMVARVAASGHLTTRHSAIGRATSSVKEPEVGLAGGALEPGTEAAIKSARRGGAPLDSGVRGAMESAFGTDFSQVKLHSGTASAELNDRVQAKAFTIGNDIFFRDGVPDGRTSHGQELLAHELTHTIQQGGAKTLPD
jgi:hypothetical protein